MASKIKRAIDRGDNATIYDEIRESKFIHKNKFKAYEFNKRLSLHTSDYVAIFDIDNFDVDEDRIYGIDKQYYKFDNH